MKVTLQAIVRDLGESCVDLDKDGFGILPNLQTPRCGAVPKIQVEHCLSLCNKSGESGYSKFHFMEIFMLLEGKDSVKKRH